MLDSLSEFDFGYGTAYAGALYESSGMVMQSETYGARVYSYGKQTVASTILKQYSWDGEFEFVPADFTPFMLTMMWSRPD